VSTEPVIAPFAAGDRVTLTYDDPELPAGTTGTVTAVRPISTLTHIEWNVSWRGEDGREWTSDHDVLELAARSVAGSDRTG
jgi:hypothetical protein